MACVCGYASVFKCIELVFALIALLLIATPMSPISASNIFCSDVIYKKCFASLLYPIGLAIMTIIVLIGILFLMGTRQMLPISDCGIPLLGALCWYGAGGVIIYVIVVQWEKSDFGIGGQSLANSWYAATVFCFLVGVVHTVEAVAMYTCPSSYHFMFYVSEEHYGFGYYGYGHRRHYHSERSVGVSG